MKFFFAYRNVYHNQEIFEHSNSMKLCKFIKRLCAMIILTKQEENRSPEKWEGAYSKIEESFNAFSHSERVAFQKGKAK